MVSEVECCCSKISILHINSYGESHEKREFFFDPDALKLRPIAVSTLGLGPKWGKPILGTVVRDP